MTPISKGDTLNHKNEIDTIAGKLTFDVTLEVANPFELQTDEWREQWTRCLAITAARLGEQFATITPQVRHPDTYEDLSIARPNPINTESEPDLVSVKAGVGRPAAARVLRELADKIDAEFDPFVGDEFTRNE